MENASTNITNNRDKFGFVLTLLFIIIEFGRPMDMIPLLRTLHLGMILDILLVLSWLIRGNIAQVKSRQTTFTFLFILLLATYIVFARNNYRAYRETKTVLLYMPFFISVIIYINSFERLKKFFNVWIILMVYLSVKGLLGKGIAGSNFLNDENDFSLLMDLMLPFGIFLFLFEKQIKRKILLLVGSILVIGSIVVSFSRGGFVGLLFVFMVAWLFSPKKIASLMIVGILVGALYFLGSHTYWNEMRTISDPEESTTKQRIEQWTSAWHMFLDKPLGVGGENYPVWYPDYQNPDIKRSMWGREAHSLWFTLLPELGIFGVIIYFSLIYYNLRDIFSIIKLKYRTDENLRYAYYLSLALLASLAGFFSAGSFISVLYYPHFFYLTAMTVAIKKIVDRSIVDKERLTRHG
ncbi:MAG: O-antigen ligase family protein [Deltaproteobacteria bacterium]|nr:O-antigen ligase family protein [Deltaproteobacteria bacterium]